MTKKKELERPPAKDHVVSARVPDDVYQAAADAAAARGSTISKIVQAFLHLFAAGETPPGWPPELPELEVRAEKRTKRGRRRPK